MNNSTSDHDHSLCNELLDYILYICFNFVTDELALSIRNKTNIYTLERMNIPNTEYIQSVAEEKKVSSDKNGNYDTSSIVVKQWSINKKIHIHFTYYLHEITECFVYCGDIQDNIIVIGTYMKNKIFEFYSNEEQHKAALDFAIGLFYILEPELFKSTPTLELIAKNIIKIR